MMDRVLQKRIVPVCVLDDAESAVPLAEALQAAGLDILEITLRTPAALPGLRKVRAAFPGMLLGAGTILAPEQVRQAHEAGANFGVSAGLCDAVVTEANRLGMPFIPGVATATEVERAIGLGCTLLKFFPAELAGGPAMVKAWAGPYGHTGVKFVPLGGINMTSARAYLAIPIVAAVGGSWMVERKLIVEKQWAKITQLTKDALAMAAEGKA